MTRPARSIGLGRTLATAAMGAWLLGGGAPAHGSTVVPMSLAALASSAQLIVDGTVAEIRHVVGPAGAERLVLVRVGTTWKGDEATSVYVRLPGGTVGRYETRVPGAPDVVLGDRHVWFLAAAPGRGHVVLGLHQGAMRVLAGPAGEALVLTMPPATGSGGAQGGARGTRGALQRVPRPLEQLADDVRRLLGGGAPK